jgi:hypothetical protein
LETLQVSTSTTGLFFSNEFRYNHAMCRNIRKLRQPDRVPTDEELHDAALQFVPKVSGYRVPSRANQAAFDRAVADIGVATRALFVNLANTDESKHRVGKQ